jgi:signal transduction histidine kinase/CheY-like chemotaxis protein/HPt (histidine-containing phosphotransfer) domain-containing protein
MPKRLPTPGLLWAALAAQLALLLLLLLPTRERLGVLDGAAVALVALGACLTAAAAWGSRRASPQPAPPADAEPPHEAIARSHFLSQLSHEIRTPLNAVIGMTQLTLQTPVSPEQRELLTKADGASRALLGLVVDALDVARLEAGQTQVERQPLRLEDVVTQAVEQVRPLHANPGVALICDWADASLLGARGELLGDGARLQQAIVNLLATALRFTSTGQVVLRVATRPSDTDGQVPVLITVQDSGPGMSAAQLDHLLGKALAPDTLASMRYAGAGLALSIGQRLVQLLGGELDAQSQPGRGSSFEIRLRLARNPQALPPARLPEQRLLLAKARTEGQEATLAMLSHLGLAPGLAASHDALTTLQTIAQAAQVGRPFDALLLDWLLPGPGPTGADLLAQVRRDHPSLRIAVLTPPGPQSEPAQARAFGAKAICPEPLLPADVRRLLAPTPAPVADGGPGTDANALAGLRVLLVEDHLINQEIAVRMLGSRGALIDVAGDGQAGLDRLLAAGPSAYDLVLMDLQMPVMDGLTATRRLRETPGFEHLPVVAMTAHALAEEKAQCLAAGMQGHIAKPLNMGRLVQELQRYLPAPAPAEERPVLDMQLGLRQFDGQAALYRRTLQGFADQYADRLARWPGWLAEGAWADLRRAAHTLQGLAATLGARPLHVAALAVERSAVLTDAITAAAQLQRVQESLTEVLQAIEAALTAPWNAPDDALADAAPARIEDLRDLLNQSDSRALDWWQAHRAAAPLTDAQRQAVDAALSTLDFEAAAAALSAAEPSPP